MKMDIPANASEERSTGFVLLPVGGSFRAMITECETTASRKGQPGWIITMKIIEPDDWGEKTPKYWLWFHTETKRMGNTMQDLRALGFDARPGMTIDIPEQQVVGRIVAFKVTKHRSYTKQDGSKGTAEDLELFLDPGAGKLDPKTVKHQAGFGETPEEGDVPF